MESLEEVLSTLAPEEMKLLIATGKRSNRIGKHQVKSLIYHPYWMVKVELPDMLKNARFTELVQELFEKKLKRAKPKDVFSVVLWVKDELEAIYRLESEYLSSPPDTDLVNAGIKDLDQLGEFNVIDNLVTGWNGAYSHEDVKSMPYHFIFDKLRKNNIEAKISKRYQKIIMEKNKKR